MYYVDSRHFCCIFVIFSYLLKYFILLYDKKYKKKDLKNLINFFLRDKKFHTLIFSLLKGRTQPKLCHETFNEETTHLNRMGSYFKNYFIVLLESIICLNYFFCIIIFLAMFRRENWSRANAQRLMILNHFDYSSSMYTVQSISWLSSFDVQSVNQRC